MPISRLYGRGKKGIYLCSSKLKYYVPRLADEDMQVLRDVILDCAYFYCFKVITYAVMPTEFRILLESSEIKPVSDAELIDRYSRTHGKRTTRQLKYELRNFPPRTERGRKTRKKQKDRMHSMEYFIVSVKRKFTRYFSRTYDFTGPLWNDLYFSRPVEYGNKPLVAKIAAFVDAWPGYSNMSLRATEGSVAISPDSSKSFRVPRSDFRVEEYPFSGYSDAVRGSREFRGSIRKLTGKRSWKSARSAYLKCMADAEHLLGLKRLPKVFGNIDAKTIQKMSTKGKLNSRRIIYKGTEGFFEERVKELKEYKKRFGHYDVPKNWKENPRLGRWLADQRYRKKKMELSLEHFNILEDLGVTWEIGQGVRSCTDGLRNRPSAEERWEKGFRELKEFVQKNGHAQVPARYRENPGLGYWAWSQRTRKKKGKLSEEHITRLEKVGFDWDILYTGSKPEKVVRVVDGDTFFTEGRMQSIRLLKVDTPERGKKGYAEAKKALQDLIKGKEVDINVVASDHYGRFLAYVMVDGISVNDAMKKFGKKHFK